MTPSIQFASGFQIAILVDRIASAMRTAGFPKDLFQEVLDHQPDLLTPELLEVVRKHVEGGNPMIIHRVRVDRTRSKSASLLAIGGIQHIDRKVVDSAPTGDEEDVDVYIFKPGPECYIEGRITCEEVARQYERYHLKPDLQAVAALHEEDPSWSARNPHAMQWHDGEHYCFASFGEACGRRRVNVNRYVHVWDDHWSFAGVRKNPSSASS